MLSTIFNILKVSVIIAIAAAFMVAILNLLFAIENLVFGNFIGEFFDLVSMYLPFNASVVFGSLASTIIAILSFLIAKKIFDLTSWSISAI